MDGCRGKGRVSSAPETFVSPSHNPTRAEYTSGLTGSSELQQVTGSDSASLKARALSSVTGPLQSQPGEKYAYGNQGMNIAARIVEIVSGLPYEEFLQQRLFDPLGMTETTFWPSETQITRLAG